MGLLVAEIRQVLHALLAESCGINSNHQPNQLRACAYIRGGTFTANVLFTGLKRERVSGTPLRVGRAANNSTRHLPDVRLLAGE